MIRRGKVGIGASLLFINCIVWTVEMPGWLLKLALKEFFRSRAYLDFSGDFTGVEVSGVEFIKKSRGRVSNYTIHGQRIHSFRRYRVAIPEGIARGAYKMSSLLKLAFSQAKDTGVPVWTANIEHLRRVKKIKAR